MEPNMSLYEVTVEVKVRVLTDTFQDAADIAVQRARGSKLDGSISAELTSAVANSVVVAV